MSNYYHNNCNPNEDEFDEFRDPATQAGEFKHTLSCRQGLENPDSFYYAIL